MVLMEIAQKKFSSRNILIADNALIKMTCPTASVLLACSPLLLTDK